MNLRNSNTLGSSLTMRIAILLLGITALVPAASAAKPGGGQDGWRPKRTTVIQASATTEQTADKPGSDQADLVLPNQPADVTSEPAAGIPAEPAEEITAAPTPAVAAAPPEITAAPAAPAPQASLHEPGPALPPEIVPACVQCGATCNLIPFCRCEPATRKKPKTIYESKCELVCEPAVGLLGHHQPKTDGCTSCGAACGPSRICKKKTLIKTVKEEDVCHVERKVGYLCRCCAGECGGCDNDACGAKPAGRRPPLFSWKPFTWLEQLWW
jgi:hypothetical protein